MSQNGSERAKDVTIYGPTVSTFTRICAIVAAEAELSWEIIPTGSGSADMAEHHPFMRSPAVYLDGLHFYETPAICSYIDRAHNRSRLHPDGHEAQARMWQWANIAAHYVFPITEERLVMPRVVAPLMGRQPNEQMIGEALPVIRYHLEVVEKRLAETAFLAGADLSLADYFMYPVIEATCAASEGRDMVAGLPLLESWWQAVAQRSAVKATAWPDVSTMAEAQTL